MRLLPLACLLVLIPLSRAGELEVRVFTDALTLGTNGPIAA